MSEKTDVVDEQIVKNDKKSSELYIIDEAADQEDIITLKDTCKVIRSDYKNQ